MFTFKNLDIRLTASIGIEEMKKGGTLAAFVETVDKKMSRSKFLGKNRIVSEQ